MTTPEEYDVIARRYMSVVISCKLSLNLDILVERLWDLLGLVRVYTKKRGALPDFSDPLILTPQRGRCTVETAIQMIHRELKSDFRWAYVWGSSSKHSPQRVGLHHELEDEDVLQIVKK
eukprot:Platyproteum_vivax@DN11991_c0_g1_i1.p1